MKKIISLITLGFALSMSAAYAADDAKTPQQNKMGTCNKDAGDKKGDERKAFMKECLSAKPAKAESKLGACSREAKEKGLKGDDRKKYLSDCNKK